jgi:hypothetical protein
MRMRILALSGALAASTLITAPAMADTTTPDAAPVTPAPAPAKFRNSCNPAVATLPGVLEGNPTLVPGARDGFAPLALYVWHEARGWRVRLTHNLPKAGDGKPQVVEVRGRITSSRPISHVRTVRLEDKQRGEWVSVQRPKRKVMDFRFVNGGYIDGIDFNAGCAGKLTFTAWQVVREATTKMVVGRTPLEVRVGATRQVVTDTAVTANPKLVTTPEGAVRVVVLRTPVTAAP